MKRTEKALYGQFRNSIKNHYELECELQSSKADGGMTKAQLSGFCQSLSTADIIQKVYNCFIVQPRGG